MKQTYSVVRVYLCLVSIFVFFSISTVLQPQLNPRAPRVRGEAYERHRSSPSSVGASPTEYCRWKVASGEYFLPRPRRLVGQKASCSSTFNPLLFHERPGPMTRDLRNLQTSRPRQVTSVRTATHYATMVGVIGNASINHNSSRPRYRVRVNPSTVVGGTHAGKLRPDGRLLGSLSEPWPVTHFSGRVHKSHPCRRSTSALPCLDEPSIKSHFGHEIRSSSGHYY
jgi:hypothetical protein